MDEALEELPSLPPGRNSKNSFQASDLSSEPNPQGKQWTDMSPRDAVLWVRQGEALLKHPQQGSHGGQHNPVRNLRRRLRGALNWAHQYFFVVVDILDRPTWQCELRWHVDPAKAPTLEAKGRLVLSDVTQVTATLLQDDDCSTCMTPSAEHLQGEFRVVCHGYSIKLRAPNRESMKHWVMGISHLSRRSRLFMKLSLYPAGSQFWEDVAAAEFARSGSNDAEHGDSGMKELASLMQSMTLTNGLDSALADSAIGASSRPNDARPGSLGIGQFAQIFGTIAAREALGPWFTEYAQPVSIPADGTQTVLGISFERFASFAVREQREIGNTVDLDSWNKLQEPFVIQDGKQRYLTESGFSYMMCSSRNALFDPAKRATVYQDMTLPLASYWISSSHNTYLEGDQWFGLSTLEQYIDVLKSGCRCVEIDCWDGDTDEPMVTHGWTPTTRLTFSDVVRVCRDFGFVASPYPLILSLEVHCGPRSLKRMGQILNAALGDQLLRLPEGGLEAAELPSPEAAMGMVIVKGKLHEVGFDDTSTSSGFYRRSISSHGTSTPRSNSDLSSPGLYNSTGNNFLNLPEQQGPDGPPSAISSAEERDDSKDSVVGSESSGSNSHVDSNSTGTRSWRSAKLRRSGCRELTMNTSEDYNGMVFLQGRKWPKQVWMEPVPALLPCNIVSFSDKRAMRFLAERGRTFAQEHHRNYLSRVYPVGTTVRSICSKNPNPVPLWLGGFQMVALNYQSADLPLVLNEGLFRNENGGAGYVLKPPLLNAEGPSPGLGCTLEVTVLSGLCLPKPAASPELGASINPMVRITMCGASDDHRVAVTEKIIDNGFNPCWKQSFKFKLSQPAVAILAFEVLHCPHRVLGSRTSSGLSMEHPAPPPRGGSAPARRAARGASAVGSALRPWRRQPKPPAPHPESLRAAGDYTITVNSAEERAKPKVEESRPETPTSKWLRRSKSSRNEPCLVAAAAFPVSGIRPGLRWAQLLDWRHQAIPRCGLLLSVQLSGPGAEASTSACASSLEPPPRASYTTSSVSPGYMQETESAFHDTTAAISI